MTSILSLLAGRKALIGTILAMPLPEVAELAVRSGFDWLWIDIEHGLFEVADVQRAAMAAGQTPCLARIPMCDEAWIKRTLDTGVAGLIIPMVNTPEIAQRAVRAMRFPPLGARSVGLGRAYGYGYDFTDYVESANEDLALFVQIEHIQAVENLEAILDVKGVNGVIIGPFDLSASMGKLGLLDDPEVRAKITYVRDTCLSRGVPLGIYAANADYGRRAVREGYQLVAIGSDLAALGNAWKTACTALAGDGPAS